VESAERLVRAEDLRLALDGELDTPSRLLPVSPIAPALVARRDDVADWAYRQVSGSFTPAPETVVAVSKARHGVRPVAIWDLPSRLLYGALVARLAPALAVRSRGPGTWRGFQQQPLDTDGDYIVAADIASCYQFIDHALLAEELLIQAGDYETVGAITGLLRETSGRIYGVPQQSTSSDVLAEVFLDKLERALLRRGLIVSRYNDDFRLTCNSWSEVVRSIEALSEEARLMGMVLNDSKMFTWSRSRYSDYLEESDQLRSEIAGQAELDLESFEVDQYDDVTTFNDFDLDDVELLTATRILERWSEVASSGRVPDDRRAEHRALLQLLPVAFAALSATGSSSDEALNVSMQMLRYEQTMTPHVARYLIGQTDEAGVLRAFDHLLRQDAYLTGWQTWWLQQPLSRIPNFSKGRGGPRRRKWASDAFASADRSPVLRSQAAMTLARHRLIDVDQLLRVYDRSTPVVRPIVVAAIALLTPTEGITRAVTSDSQLDRWVFDWARQNA
jgi:RNA-directed DNA polymerase